MLQEKVDDSTNFYYSRPFSPTNKNNHDSFQTRLDVLVRAVLALHCALMSSNNAELETHPTLQNDTMGVLGCRSDGPMIHPPISTPPHFDRPLTRTAFSTAASQRRCNNLLQAFNE